MALPASVKSVKEALAHDAKVLRSLIVTPAIKPMPKERVMRPAGSKEGKAARPEDDAKPVEKVVTNEVLEKRLEEILK